MKIIIAGASGFVGTALSAELKALGHEVIKLTRVDNSSSDSILWDLNRSFLELPVGFDALINLTGENVGSGPWTKSKRRAIMDSRVMTTELLVSAMAKLNSGHPKVLINASAVGFYGTNRREILDETSNSGDGFLAEVCRAWEGEAHKAETLGVRVVCARFGVVLAPEGGALKKMLLPFRLGLGGPIGNGKQHLSWVSRADAVQALIFLLQTESLKGAVNITAPEWPNNSEFTKKLARALHKPAFLPLPASLLKLALGDMAKETLLTSLMVRPAKLQAAGFKFNNPTLDSFFAENFRA